MAERRIGDVVMMAPGLLRSFKLNRLIGGGKKIEREAKFSDAVPWSMVAEAGGQTEGMTALLVYDGKKINADRDLTVGENISLLERTHGIEVPWTDDAEFTVWIVPDFMLK